MFSRNGIVFCYLSLFAFLIANNAHAAKALVRLSDGSTLVFYHAEEGGGGLLELSDLIRNAADATEYSVEEFHLASTQEGLKSLQLLNSGEFTTVDRLAVAAYGKYGASICNLLRPNAGRHSGTPQMRTLSNQTRRLLIDRAEPASFLKQVITDQSGQTLTRFERVFLLDTEDSRWIHMALMAPDEFTSVVKDIDAVIAKAPALDKPYLYRATLVPKGLFSSGGTIRPGSYVGEFGFMSTSSDIRSILFRYTPAGGGAAYINKSIDAANQKEIVYTIKTNSRTKALNISGRKFVKSIDRLPDGRLDIIPDNLMSSDSERLLPRESRFRVKAISEPVDVRLRGGGTHQRRSVVLEHIPDDETIDADILDIYSGDRMNPAEFSRVRSSGACGP